MCRGVSASNRNYPCTVDRSTVASALDSLWSPAPSSCVLVRVSTRCVFFFLFDCSSQKLVISITKQASSRSSMNKFVPLACVVLSTVAVTHAAERPPLAVVVVEQIPFLSESGSWVAEKDKAYHGYRQRLS